MTQAAAYLRVSPEDQVGEDKFGLTDQRATIDSFAKAQGFELARVYSDEGISGATMDRPGLQDLLAEADNGIFEVVIVVKLDRLARGLMPQLWIEKELLRHNVGLISVAEPFREQDPADILLR